MVVARRARARAAAARDQGIALVDTATGVDAAYEEVRRVIARSVDPHAAD